VCYDWYLFVLNNTILLCLIYSNSWHINPQLISFFSLWLKCLPLSKFFIVESESLAECVICERKCLNKIECLVFWLEKLTTWPDYLWVIVMQNQWESIFFEQRSVQVSINILYLSLHTCPTLQEQIWVSTDQVSHVGLGFSWVCLNHFNFLVDHITSVQHDKFRVLINDSNNLSCTHFVMELQIVEQTNKVRDFACKESAWFNTNVHDLFLGQLVLLELS